MKKPIVKFAALVFGGLCYFGVKYSVPYFSNSFEAAAYSEQEMSDVLLQSNLKIYATLKTHFPADFAQIATELTQLVKSGASRNEMARAAPVIVAKVRKKYASQLAFASDADNGRLLTLWADFHHKILRNEGTKTCGKYAMSGPMGVPGVAKKYPQDMDAQGVAYFETVARAIKAPHRHEAVRDDDWGAAARVMIERGHPEAYLQILGNQQATHPDFCAALVAFMQAIVSTPGEEGVRVRAAFAKDVAGS